MAVALKAGDCTQRLADQLQTLSEVAETLTFRLLELEERLAAHELKLQPLLAGAGSSAELDGDTELRLGDTEDRLARLEGLLSGLESPGAARHLHSVGSAAVAQAGSAAELVSEARVLEELVDEGLVDEGLVDEELVEEELVDEEPVDEEPSFLDGSVAEASAEEELAFAEEQQAFVEEQTFLDELSA